jgi:hypothetical protein
LLMGVSIHSLRGRRSRCNTLRTNSEPPLAAETLHHAPIHSQNAPSAQRDVTPRRAPINPFLAPSAVPIGHGDSAQSDWSTSVGPLAKSKALGGEELQYQHVGPAHFGIAISAPYPDGKRVIWTNGGDRISKLDYETLEVIAELPIGDAPPQSSEQADADIARLDAVEGLDRANTGIELAVQYMAGLSGVYYLLDVDNALFVAGSESIIAYCDDGRPSPVRLRDEWRKPAHVPGVFVGANLTFDGRIAMVTDCGWIVLVERDFSSFLATAMVGAEDAEAHNAAMTEQGFRSGAGEWVRNSLAIDENGGIYVASVDRVHKVIWNGAELSTDPVDGAWTERYSNSLGAGTGATPSLMGFDDEDRFVVITDGDELMNVVLFWRDEIPEGWEPPVGALSPRVAGQQPATVGDPNRTSIQSEQSVVVAGYGSFIVNNDPASIPDGFPTVGNRVLVGYSGADPAFTPRGVQKFEWDPDTQLLGEAWVNTVVGSANSVPIVSADLSAVYTVGARHGQWTLEALDWHTGESAFHWMTGSSRYNTLFSGLNIDQDGRIVHTTMFGIVRYRP